MALDAGAVYLPMLPRNFDRDHEEDERVTLLMTSVLPNSKRLHYGTTLFVTRVVVPILEFRSAESNAGLLVRAEHPLQFCIPTTLTVNNPLSYMLPFCHGIWFGKLKGERVFIKN